VRSRCPNAHIAYDMVDFHSLRMTREAALRNDPKILAEAEQQRAVELACASSADVTIAVSEAEKAALLELLPEAVVEVVPLVFELGAWPPPGPAGREGLLFVGGFYHTPNVDAVRWFVERVLPIIRREAPDLVLRIAGANPSEEVLALARQPGVEVLGFVSDLGPLYDRHRVCIAPLRFGAGMKGKVAQSMASGLPIVSTSIGIEGMALEEGAAVLVADGEAEFAAHVLRLLRDDELWLRLSTQGRAYIERTLSVEAVRPLLEAILRG
jgi:O-antigen biosynthesis protein